MEFSGLYDIAVNSVKENIIENLEYFTFVKFSDKLYIDISNIGSIIIPFNDIVKYESLNIYYELSLLLIIKERNRIVEMVGYERSGVKNYNKWFIDCAYLFEDCKSKSKSIENGKYCPYLYNVNPQDLKDMDVSPVQDIEKFYNKFNNMYGYNNLYFEKRLTEYTNRIVVYNIKWIEEQMDEITSSKSYKNIKNISSLLELYKIDEMNSDIVLMIYYNLIKNAKERSAYDPYVFALLSG